MIIAALLAFAAQAAAPASIEGQWRSPGGNSIIRVAPCGGALCGTIVWATAKAKQDAARTTGQLIGTVVLSDLQPSGGGGWRGKLFIPDRNMRVTAKIQAAGDGQLRVAGCALGKSLCKAALWTRADGPLPAN